MSLELWHYLCTQSVFKKKKKKWAIVITIGLFRGIRSLLWRHISQDLYLVKFPYQKVARARERKGIYIYNREREGSVNPIDKEHFDIWYFCHICIGNSIIHWEHWHLSSPPAEPRSVTEFRIRVNIDRIWIRPSQKKPDSISTWLKQS